MTNPNTVSLTYTNILKIKHYLTLSLALLMMSLASGVCVADSASDPSQAGYQELEFDLQSYKPDQSLWADKMKLKYEKARQTDQQPLALLKIGRLNLEAPVYFGADTITLDRGLGYVEGTTPPGSIGNIALSGHRDSFFRVLKDVEIGDLIEMRTTKGIEKFEVSEISIVDALEVSILDPTENTVLTLITCHPFYYEGYAPDRYIVRALPVSAQHD